jgi:small subunit ribosomal protein S4e
MIKQEEKNKMYVKRQTVAKSWPIPRKGTKYIVVASHEKNRGLPVLIILRDLLKIAENRKEVKKILNQELISVNDKIVKKSEFSVLPFDNIKIGKKNYELSFSDKNKFMLKETTKIERILKVVGKNILKKKRIQLNLLYGKNIITDEKVKMGDSVVLAGRKIVKILSLEKGKEAVVFAGKHKGREGKIEKIEDKIATLSYKEEKINAPVKNIMVIN